MNSKIIENYKILLVDDNPDNLKFLFNVLSLETSNLLVASNGKQAIEQTLKHKPDAIIMDWDMPELDGLTATKIIRETPAINDTPIIIATGRMTSAKDFKKAIEAGANDYIKVPYEAIEIKARVRFMIKIHEKQQQNSKLEKEILQQQIEFNQYELKKQKQTLTILKIRLIQKQEYIEQILNNLQKIYKGIDGNVKKVMRNFISKLQTDIKRGNQKELEIHFEKIHPSFLKNIIKQFPDLTKNEIKLCMFYKLNMTKQEILTITYKTDNALKKARQRLRKKIGLKKEDSLADFIQKMSF